MSLLKIKDFDPNYREVFGGYDIKGLDVYSDINNEKIGDVHDLLVDEQGYFRYFIVDLGFWAFGKKVLLPVECSQADSEGKHLYAIGFTKDQIETLPEFNESLKVGNGHEAASRANQGTSSPARAPLPPTPPPVTPVEAAPPISQVPPTGIPQTGYPIQNQPAQPYPTAQPPYPPTNQIPAQNQIPVQGQTNYPPIDPRTQPGYRDPMMQAANVQSPSVLQRFEERLRTKRQMNRGR